jgi:crotonobetainyl-CoA:carnitine CoA-transferase CaiB-like acyl-CoA transferase
MGGLADTLTGLRVLDLSSNLAGPLCAMVMAELGADVIKVERAGSGEDTRLLPPRWHDWGTVFIAVNRGKRSLALDLKTDEAREALGRLIEQADVLVESFGPGAAERLGLAPEQVRERNPRIIHVTISAFGDGPIGRTLPGYDALIQAFSGMMDMTGHPGQPPARVAASAVDLSTGLWATVAVLAALRRGEGAHVNAALVDSAFMLQCHQLIGYLATGEPPQRLGSGGPSTAPYEAFQAADGWVVIAGANQAQWERMCPVLGLEGLPHDERFATTIDRVRNREPLRALIAEKVAPEPVQTWIDRLGAVGVGAGRVNNLSEALEHPLVAERGLLVPSDPEGPLHGLAQLRLPIDADGTCLRREPPRLGEHSAQVLAEAGFDGEKIEVLVCARARRVDSGATAG